MARTYHVDIAIHAAGADRKWLDNLLSHNQIDGVLGGRQGVARRVTEEAIYSIVLVRRLTGDLGVSIARAISVAAALLRPGVTSIALPSGIILGLDRDALERDVTAAIAEAVEAVVPARRGRPAGMARSELAAASIESQRVRGELAE